MSINIVRGLLLFVGMSTGFWIVTSVMMALDGVWSGVVLALASILCHLVVMRRLLQWRPK